MKNLELHILQTYIKDGNMNTAARFYPEGMTAEQRREDFLNRRIALGEAKGFNGRLMFMADQNDKNGSYKIIEDEIIAKNPNGWADINEDILVINEKHPEVVIGHPVADCPVLILIDPIKRATAIAHCSAEMTDMKLPMAAVEALRDAYDSKVSDMVAYISACAGPNWQYDRYPRWATDSEVWKNSIIENDNLYNINIRQAIKEQLIAQNIDMITFNPDDTITDPRYFSNSASSKGEEEKAGRHFAGAYYKIKK